jgi:hypothetical protein
VNEKAPHCGAFCYLPVGEAGPPGASVEPLGEGLMWVFPDGFTVLLRPAAALPALLGTPVLEVLPAALPVVVPPVEEPAVAPLVAAPPVPELPPDAPPLDCASAKLLVTANAVASPSVVSFMIAPFPRHIRRNTMRAQAFLRAQSQIVAVPRGIPRSKQARDLPRKDRKTAIAIRYVSHL